MKETLKNMILAKHSKEQRDLVIAWVGKNEALFKMLMDFMLGRELRIVQRASWAVRFIVEQEPSFLKPYVGKLLKAMDHPVHDAVLRHGFLALINIELSEKQIGQLAELAFDHLQDVHKPAAIKRAALLVLVKICDREPDLKAEIVLILEEQIPHSTVGFVNIARKVIKQFR